MVYACDRSFVLSAVLSGNIRLCLLLLVVGFFSCHSPDLSGPGHSYYFDTVFTKADTLFPDQKEKVLAYLDSVYNTYPNPGPGDLYKKYDYKRHYYFEDKKDYAKAMTYVDSQLSIIRGRTDEKGYVEDYGKALFSKGDILLAQGKYSEGFLNYYQGRQAIEKTRDTCLFGEYSGRLGTACYKQSRYGEAMGYFKEAFWALDRCQGKDEFMQFVYQQGNLDNVALCFAREGKPDSALYYYDSALSYIRKNKGRFVDSGPHRRYGEMAEGVIFGNLGDIYYTKGDPAAAESLYQKSVGINVQKEYANEDAQLTQAKLIRLYLGARRFREAGMELDRLRLSLDSLPGHEVEMQWRQLEWRYNDSMQNVPQAYSYLQSYHRLKDSLDAVNKPTGVNEELQHIAQGYELDLLKKKDELKSVYLAIALLFFIMAIVIILLVVLNWRRSRKNVVVLTQLNQQVRTQNDHMQKALGALEQSQQENTRIMKIVAHDLRSPIGASGTIAEMLLKKPGLAADQQKLLELIRVSSQNSLELITDLLHMNVIPAEMKKEPLDVQSSLKYCVGLLQFKAETKKQDLLLKTVAATILGNREKMWRVISNLITNAIKFSPEGATIEVELAHQGTGIRISVRDQGIGIPEEMKEKIFDIFTEAKRRGTSGEESFGLGLSISKQIVEAHGGRIWYEPAMGEGTIFYVELPGGI